MLTERDEGVGKFLEELANETRDLTDVLFPDGVPAAGKKKKSTCCCEYFVPQRALNRNCC
jgi:hypothetical protein